jgi:glycine/D-amino acid oxidase-like deaminating enzyme
MILQENAMRTSTHFDTFYGPAHRHAVVIGASIAGLSVARVLTDHFQHVTVIERDAPPQSTAFRQGAPQARHPHVLLKGGELALEQLFPGLRQELVDHGALLSNAGLERSVYLAGCARRDTRRRHLAYGGRPLACHVDRHGRRLSAHR